MKSSKFNSFRSVLISQWPYLLFMLVLLICQENLHAQIPFSVTVGGTANDQGYALVQLPDSSYIVAGETTSFGEGGKDVYVVRFNPHGLLIWTLTLGGAGNDYARSMVLAEGGSVVLAGVTSSFGSGADDVYLVKIDSSGNIVWTHTYGGTGDDRAWKIIQTRDGGFAVAGISNSIPAKGQDMYLLKLDASGDKQWERLVDGNSAGQANYTDIGYALTELSNGNIVLFGTAAMPVSFTVELFLACFNPAGAIQWSKIITQPSTNNNFNDYARSVVSTADGGFVIGAEAALPCESGWVECNSPGGVNWHYYISKFDNLGNMAWSTFYGGGTVNGVSADGSDYLREIINTADGGFAVCGHSYAFRKDFADNTQKGTEYFVLKLNQDGEAEWSRVIGETTLESGMAIVQSYGGGYVLAGYTSPSSGPANDELSLMSIDASGNSCLPVRTGGKNMGSGGGGSTLGTIANANTTGGAGGVIGAGGLRTDLCAGSILIQVDVIKTCLNSCSGKATAQAQGGASPYTYTWQPGNLSGAMIEDLCAGTYTVQVNDQGGNSASYTVTVGTENTVLQITADGPLSFCQGGQRLLSVEAGHSTYSWNGIPGGRTLLVSDSGSYQASAISAAGCNLVSNTIEINMSPKPKASFSYDQVSGYTLQFTDLSIGAESWKWHFNETMDSDEQNPQFTFPFDGTYPVSLIVTNACGSDTLNMDVIVRKINGIQGGTEILTGFVCMQEEQMLCFKGTFKTPGTCQFRLYNLSGKVISSSILKVSPVFDYRINASELAPGIYFVELTNETGDFVQRIIKK